MATLPGLTISYYSILIMELVTALIVAIGIAKLEFLEHNQPKFLQAGAFLAQLTFIALSFGQRLTHKYEDAAQLFFYAALTFIATHIALKKTNQDHA